MGWSGEEIEMKIMHRFDISRVAFGACMPLFVWCTDCLEAQTSQNSEFAISGTVVDKSGGSVPFAYLFVQGGNTTVANGDGRFRLASDESSRVMIGVRRIGYAPLDTTINLVAGRLQSVRLEMSRIASRIDTVFVKASSSEYDDYLDRAGYYQRLARRIDGTFLSQREIEKRNSLTLTGVLRDVNGVRVASQGGLGRRGDFVLGRGGLCALGLVVDGQRVDIDVPPIESFQPRITSIVGSRAVSTLESRRSPTRIESLDEMVNLMGVAAVEVYPSATSVPNGLQHHVRGCGLIVVWTRFQ